MIFSRAICAIVTTAILVAFTGCATFQDDNQRNDILLPEGHPDIAGERDRIQDPKVDAYAGYIHGLLLDEEGKSDEALEYLEMSANLDSSSPASLIQMMRIYAEKNRRDEAEHAGKRALAIDPDIPEVHFALGQIMLESGRETEALDHLRKGSQLDPDNTNALFLLAEAYERTGDRDRAVEILEKLADTQGHKALADYYLARLWIRSGEFDKAADLLVRAVKLNPSFVKPIGELGEQLQREDRSGEAITLFKHILERDPENMPVREFLAKILLMEGQYDEARRQLDIILKNNSEDAGAMLLLGLVEARDGDKSKALEIFTRLHRASGSTFEILMQIGSLQRELEMYVDAQITFEDAARISPERYEPYLNLAIIHDALGNTAKAEESARKALDLEPRQSNIRAYLAQIMTRTERYDEAIDLLNEGLREDASDTTLLYQLGITYDISGQFNLTVKTLETLLQADPDHADALNYLGYSWADRDENLDKALQLIEKALSIRPDAAHIVDSLGWVHYRMGNYEEALQYLLEAARKMSDDPTVLDHVGDTYDKLGNKDLAIQYWSRALAADPENNDIAEKLRRNKAGETGP